jgi:hypothetical protein
MTRTSIVDEDIEPSKLCYNLLDTAVDGIGITLVQLYGETSPTDFLHGIHSRACPLRVTDVRNRNVYTRFCEAPRYCAADIARTSGHKGSFSGEVHYAPPIRHRPSR